jgi:hypothetical protein
MPLESHKTEEAKMKQILKNEAINRKGARVLPAWENIMAYRTAKRMNLSSGTK